MSLTRGETGQRRRRSPEEIGALIGEFRRSGVTAQEFADGRGVCVQTVYRWLREEEVQPVSQPLVPVRITTPTTQDPIRFIHSSGWRVEVPASMAQEPLLQLLTALAAC